MLLPPTRDAGLETRWRSVYHQLVRRMNHARLHGGRAANSGLGVLFCSLAVVAGCSDLFGPALPDGTVLIAPLPVEYERWWQITEVCSGLRADLADVEFRMLPASQTLPDSDAVGAHYSNGNVIVLVEGVARDGYVVRHEMLHALLSKIRLNGHPKDYFETRCGGLVSCGEVCSDEVGGIAAEAHGAPLLKPDDAEVTVQILPSIVTSPPEEAGCMSIVVRARNVGAEASVIDLRSQKFQWWVEAVGGGSGGTSPPNDSVLVEPGGSRHAIFDCPTTLASLEPGEYWVEGEWDRVRSGGAPLSVIP